MRCGQGHCLVLGKLPSTLVTSRPQVSLSDRSLRLAKHNRDVVRGVVHAHEIVNQIGVGFGQVSDKRVMFNFPLAPATFIS
jgi:hypothetical protein